MSEKENAETGFAEEQKTARAPHRMLKEFREIMGFMMMLFSVDVSFLWLDWEDMWWDVMFCDVMTRKKEHWYS